MNRYTRRTVELIGEEKKKEWKRRAENKGMGLQKEERNIKKEGKRE